MNDFKLLLSLLKPSTKRRASLPLFNFSQPQAFKDWKIKSDQLYGGHSKVSFESNESQTAALFSGTISTKMPDKKEVLFGAGFFKEVRKITKTGFAACRVPVSWVARLPLAREFNAVELLVKGDDKVYNLNITPYSFSKRQIYQSQFKAKNTNEWQSKIIHFRDLILLHQGKPVSIQRAFDHGQIENIGFSIADEQEGPFHLEIKEINLIATDIYRDGEFG